MLRIWFNRTYGTGYQVIGMLRANPDGRPVHVIGTHVDPDSPVLAACDEAYPEPEVVGPDGPGGLDGPAYVDWALRFARDHRVDVLVPRLHMAELADARATFEAGGTRLVCADGDTVRLLADKDAAYRAAARLGVPVPPYRVVRSADELRAAYAEFARLVPNGPDAPTAAEASGVVLKPVSGAGGAGYRRLTAQRPTVADLDGAGRPVLHVDDVCAALDNAWQQVREQASEPGRDTAPARMVMPYLDGPEISLDVLARPDGALLAAVGRTRSRRRRLIVDDVPARRVAEALGPPLRIGYLSNTQVRYWQGPQDPQPRPYLLEVNTRVSGGLFQTALAGVNLPWAAVRLALGEEVDALRPRYGAAFAALPSLLPLPARPRW